MTYTNVRCPSCGLTHGLDLPTTGETVPLACSGCGVQWSHITNSPVSSKTTISTNCVNCRTGWATGEVEDTDEPTPYMVYCPKCDHSWARIHTPYGYVAPGTPTVEGFVKPGTEIDVKRFYLPGVTLRATCPKCNHPWVQDMGSDYLSYPVANVPFEDNAYCTKCEHEWTFKLRLNLSLEVV